MKYLLSELTPGATALAVYDVQSWGVPSYANVYILTQGDQAVLIDAGARAYEGILKAALQDIGLTTEQVRTVYLTHGHWDHVEGAAAFRQAAKFIHREDLVLVPETLAPQFSLFTDGGVGPEIQFGGRDALEVIHVNTHSPGSVALYDAATRILFVGDFFCFFGEELPEGKLVSDSEVVRAGCCQYVAGQAAQGGREFERFMAGLEKLLPYEPEFFCTGHGVVLQGDIRRFLTSLYESGKRNAGKK